MRPTPLSSSASYQPTDLRHHPRPSLDFEDRNHLCRSSSITYSLSNMAFHQPTRQALQRAIRPPAEERDASSLGRHHHDQQQQLDQSQTSWVLFQPSPATDETATTSEFSEAGSVLHTPGRSRLSALGSLDTVARSDRHDASPSVTPSAVEDDAGDDDGELDSLDSHLPSFRSLPGRHTQSQHGNMQSAPVLPGHDGLGSFHLDQPTGVEAQDQIYQFERFNPRRMRRRRSSLERVQVELDNQQTRDLEKRQRIEAWRLDHSRILLDEVQRETRRSRRRSQASLQHTQSMPLPATGSSRAVDAESDNMTWHDDDAMVAGDQSEGLLARFTQKVIKDILGIDERMLSILLGETIPEDDELSSTPRASQITGQAPLAQTSNDESWQTQILERVSRELGLLVNQLSHHPGAFSTYSRIQQMPLPYAGLPVIPESSTAAQADSQPHSESPTVPEFRPTVNQQSKAINIPGQAAPTEDVNMPNAFSKEDWERDLDMKLVFRYIRSRFSSSRPTTPSSAGPSHLSATTTQDAAAKAARVRQHHPLISRSRATERRGFKAASPSSPVALRHHSSCASQSTRRSARRSSCSSRHYWDIGGSLGTGSMIASNGPMGSWGEV